MRHALALLALALALTACDDAPESIDLLEVCIEANECHEVCDSYGCLVDCAGLPGGAHFTEYCCAGSPAFDEVNCATAYGITNGSYTCGAEPWLTPPSSAECPQ